MEKILVNASAAKKGGALTIIESFCKAKTLDADADTFYYILSPKKPDFLPEMSRWIKVSTSGVGTIFFALFFSWFIYKVLGCKKIISFSNVNTLFPASKVTYFHQFLTLTKKTNKHKIVRFLIRNTQLRNNIFIFQTPYVQDVFLKIFGFNYTTKVCWPGLSIPTNIHKKMTVICDLTKKKEQKKKVIICPISDVTIPHKNFTVLQKMSPTLSAYNIELLVTCSPSSAITTGNITAIGQLSRAEYISLVAESDGVLIVSKEETVSLPIFEAISLNKPAFVLSMPYLAGLYELFGDIPGLFEFSTIGELMDAIEKDSLGGRGYASSSFSSGCWEF